MVSVVNIRRYLKNTVKVSIEDERGRELTVYRCEVVKINDAITKAEDCAHFFAVEIRYYRELSNVLVVDKEEFHRNRKGE